MSDNEQTNKKIETVADILAEMRKGMNPNGTVECQYLESDICTFADRIEAAWKRERAKVEADALAVGGIVEAARMRTVEKSSAVGNAAAMREALKMFVDAYRTTSYTLCIENLRPAYQKAKVALALPARNCDLYDDAETARQAWLDDADNWDEFGSPELELYEWLFAPAKKEGENDGIK